MGFDKPDLGFVVHLGAPPSPIAYYQQVGRAGRAVEHAEVLLLPGVEDAAIWRYFASLAFPPEDQVRTVLAALHTDRPLSTQALEPHGRPAPDPARADAQGARRRRRGPPGAAAAGSPPGEPWTYDEARLRRVAAGPRRRAAGHARVRRARPAAGWRYLRELPGRPRRRPTAAGATAAPAPLFTADVSDAALTAAQTFLGRPGVEIDPEEALADRPRRGRRTAEGADRRRRSRRCPAGRWGGCPTWAGVAGCATWSARTRPTARSPTTWSAAVVEVLKAWAHGDDPWPRRPAGVVAVGSRSRPTAGRLARRADRRGRSAAAARPGRPAPARPASAGRAATAPSGYAPCTTPSPCRRRAGRRRWPGSDGPVLLVDDLVDSGWTMTMAARLLRRAGAPDVLPLALAVAG